MDRETNRWFGVVSAVMLNSWIRRKEEEGEKLEKLSIVYPLFEYHMMHLSTQCICTLSYLCYMYGILLP